MLISDMLRGIAKGHRLVAHCNPFLSMSCRYVARLHAMCNSAALPATHLAHDVSDRWVG